MTARARRPTTTEQGLGHHWNRVVRPAILARDRYRCHWCGNPATTVDHLVARAEGGARYDPRNLVAACSSCNSRRGAELGNRQRGRTRPAGQPKAWPGALNTGRRP